MATERHAIVRTDNMSATGDNSLMVSGRFYDAGDELAAIDNGNLVVIGGYDTNEREVRKCTTPTASADISTLGLVVTPELFYDESRYHGLEEWVNEKGAELTIMRFHANDCFGVTKEAINGDTMPEVDEYLIAGDTTKFEVSASATGTVIGRVSEIETVGADVYYVVQVTV